jgi:hypothetical protein
MRQLGEVFFWEHLVVTLSGPPLGVSLQFARLRP